MPFIPAFDWRVPGPDIPSAYSAKGILMFQLLEQKAHALGLAKPVLGWFFRSLRPPLFNGPLDRLADSVKAAYG